MSFISRICLQSIISSFVPFVWRLDAFNQPFRIVTFHYRSLYIFFSICRHLKFCLPLSSHTYYCFYMAYFDWMLWRSFICKEGERPNELEWQIWGRGHNSGCAPCSSNSTVAWMLAELMRLECFVSHDFQLSFQEEPLNSILLRHYGGRDEWTGKFLFSLCINTEISTRVRRRIQVFVLVPRQESPSLSLSPSLCLFLFSSTK